MKLVIPKVDFHNPLRNTPPNSQRPCHQSGVERLLKMVYSQGLLFLHSFVGKYITSSILRWFSIVFFNPPLVQKFPHVPSGNLTVCYWSHGPVEIVDLPTENGGSFHSYVNVYQRVHHSYLNWDLSREDLFETSISGQKFGHHFPLWWVFSRFKK